MRNCGQILYTIINFYVVFCNTNTYDLSKALAENLLRNYSRFLPPRFDQNELVTVDIEPRLDLIVDLNESQDVFEWYGAFGMRWKDEHMVWNISDYAGIEHIQLPLRDVWVPKPIIANSARKRTLYQFDNDFDYNTATVLYKNNGDAFLEAGGYLSVSCDTNIMFYPVDEHICQIKLYSEHTNLEFSEPRSDLKDIALRYYEEDPEWAVLNVSSSVNEQNGLKTFSFNIHIQRKPMHLFIGLVLPLVLASVMNCFTFLLPVHSGERASFAITLFLTFAVVMTVVSDTFPITDILSVFHIFLVLRLTTSGLTTILVIISMFLYYKETPITENIGCVEKPWRSYSSIVDMVSFIFFVTEILIEFIVLSVLFIPIVT